MAALNGLSGVDINDYSTYVTGANSTSVSNKINNLNAEATDEAAMKACKEFEQYMLEQVYKGMQKTIMYADEKGDYEKMFGDTLVQEYAKTAENQGGIGLAEQLYKAMTRNGARIISAEEITNGTPAEINNEALAENTVSGVSSNPSVIGDATSKEEGAVKVDGAAVATTVLE